MNLSPAVELLNLADKELLLVNLLQHNTCQKWAIFIALDPQIQLSAFFFKHLDLSLDNLIDFYPRSSRSTVADHLFRNHVLFLLKLVEARCPEKDGLALFFDLR